MAIYDILCEISDTRGNEAGSCKFNGFLEDYLSMIENVEGKEEITAILSPLFELDNNLKICEDLHLNINKDAVANQIIRYKDAFKLPQGTIRCPYVVYGMFEDYQKAVIITLGEEEAYIQAKALYYVMSEPDNEFEGTRNEVIAISATKNSIEQMQKVVEAFLIKNRKAGIVQRELDSKLFENYDFMYTLAAKIASNRVANIREILINTEIKEDGINDSIASWFLMKKFSYVQYMMDKNTLNRVHDGNVKKQRQVAKEKCDAIGFISYSELWKMVKEM